MRTLEELLISRDELERIYTGKTTLYLWRSLRKSSKVSNPLYPDFEDREIKTGVVRLADVKSKMINGVLHVVAQLGKGTSLFDKEGAFGYNNWDYFEIPAGTPIPVGLIITKDGYNERYGATHYSISPNFTMPKEKFIKLLDELVWNAKVRKAVVGSD